MERDREPGRGRWPDRGVVLRILSLVGGMFVVGYLAMALGMWITAPRRTVITVPDVRWMAERQARGALEAADLKMAIGDSIPNPRVAAGAVLAQTPLPSQEVGPGSRVTVIVSSGPQRRAVPDVSMLPRDQAERVLSASGFRVVVSAEENPRGAGRVLGTEPSSGTMLPTAATVRLRISAGPPMVAVPALVGSLEGQIAAALRAVGLHLGTVNHVFDMDAPTGVVLSQSPAPGDSIRMGSAVDAVIASDQLPGTPVGVPAPREER